MRVISFSYCFPNSRKRSWGVFVYQRLSALARLVDLEVVAPVPVFPLWSRLGGPLPQARDEMAGLVVHRPRYFYVPGVLKWLDGPFYARGLRGPVSALVAQGRPDVLDAHFEWPDGVGVSLLARRFAIPYVITLRGWLYEALDRPRILRQCIEAMQGAKAIISVSHQLAETASGLGVEREKIHVIPNGVDLQRFAPQDKLKARRELGFSEDGRLLVTVAHLGPRKGHRETIQAMASLPGDVRLVLVGGDALGRGLNRQRLRGLIEQLGLGARVVLAGPQSYDQIPLYLNAADATVLASYREGCPNVVLESLACGTPVVASAVGAVPELIQPGVNGQIVPAKQVAPLAEAIRCVLDRGWSVETVRHSQAVQPWSAVAQRVYNVLDRVARESDRGGLRCVQ